MLLSRKALKFIIIIIIIINKLQRISREAWLYQLHNLVGEIGGCLGMFLGVSLVSLYQMGLGAVENAVKYVQRK